MKLVKTRIAHSDTIADDDGTILGTIYYANRVKGDVFRKWFERMTELQTSVEGLVQRIEARNKAVEERRTVTADSEPVDGGD